MNHSPVKTENETLQQWLSSSECFDLLLKRIAPVIAKKARLANINLDAIGMDEDSCSLASCLWEFLCENQHKLHDLQSVILAGDASKAVPIIINRFFAYCLDERRSDSPFHAYYAHLRKILSAESKSGAELTYDPSSNGSLYAWTLQKNLKRLAKGALSEGLPQEEAYRDWPRAEISAQDIHEKSSMLELSRFFWKEATSRQGEACLVPLYDLTTYVANVYGFGVYAPSKATHHAVAESSLSEGQLKSMARSLAGSWDAKERKIFLLRFEQELKLEDVARETGYKSAAAVDYQIKKLAGSVKEVWEQWQFGYSAGDEQLEAQQDYFFEQIIHFCKK